MPCFEHCQLSGWIDWCCYPIWITFVCVDVNPNTVIRSYMPPHNTKIVVLIPEQDKEQHHQQPLLDDRSNGRSYCTCFFVSGVLLLLISNWVSHHDQRNLQTHHTILATLLIYLLWLVVCIVHHCHHFMTDGTSNTKKWLSIFDAAFARYRSGDHTATTAVAAQSSNQPVMVVCITHLLIK